MPESAARHAGRKAWHVKAQWPHYCREAAYSWIPLHKQASSDCMGTAARRSLSSCSSASMLVPVLGALLALSKSQFLYHSLGSGSFSGTAYSVPGVSQRSAHRGGVFSAHHPLGFHACHTERIMQRHGVPAVKNAALSHSVLYGLPLLHTLHVVTSCTARAALAA